MQAGLNSKPIVGTQTRSPTWLRAAPIGDCAKAGFFVSNIGRHLLVALVLLLVSLLIAGCGKPRHSSVSALVLIDSAVREPDRLTEGLPDGTVIRKLDRDAGFAEIAEITAQYPGLNSLHIISHGKPGRLQLGNREYRAESLQSTAGPALAAIGAALAPEADILFYGCDVAGGPQGRKFVDEVAKLTGADVAASDNTTGHPAANGDWRLEVVAGEVESDILIALETRQSWPHILANSTLVWDTRPYTNFLTGGTDNVTIDNITITTTGTQTGTRTQEFHDLFPTYNYDGYTGLISSEFNATTDNGSITNTTRVAFSEPVYNLTFTIIDVDGGPSLAFRDGIQFGSDTGAFPTATFGSNVTYNAGTGYGQAVGAYCSQGSGNVPNCLLTPTFAGPVSWITFQHIAAGASGSDPAYQIIVADDLTFNTPPDATDNSNSTNESSAVGGNVITDDDGSGVDSDNQDAAAALVIQSVNGTPVPVGGLVINLASGATLTVQQDGSYTFDPNGGYEALGLGASTQEVFTYVVEDAEGLSNNDGSATDSEATLTITINGEADYDFAVTKVVDTGNVSALPATLNYTITVTNTGDTAMTGVTPVDTLDQGASSTGLTLSGPTGDGGTIGTLDVGEVWTYTASHVVTQAQMDDGNDLVNTVDVTTTEMGATVRSASDTTTITQNPAFTIVKVVDQTTITGLTTLNFTITVTNTGNISLTNPIFSDVLQQNGAGRTLTTGPTLSSGDTDTDNELDVGEAWVYTATYDVVISDIDDGNDLINNARFSSDQVGPLADSSTTTINAPPTLTVTKVADVGSVNNAGDVITYTITVTNSGVATVTGIAVSDPLLSGISCTPGTGANPNDLSSGAAATCTGTYTVLQSDFDNNGGGDGDIDNTATVTANGGVNETADEAVTLNLNPDLTVTKSADDTTGVVLGQVITYTYTVENTGNQTITNVSLSDAHNGSGPAPTPGSETLTTDSLPLGDSTDGGVNGTWDTIAPGDIVTFTATYTVTQNDVDTLQ